jgi:hypothetical protein
MITAVSRSELNCIKDKSLDDITPEDLEAFEWGDYERAEEDTGFSVRVDIPAAPRSTRAAFVQGSYRMLTLSVRQSPQPQRSANVMAMAGAPTSQEFLVAFPQQYFERIMPAAFAPLLWLNEALSLEKANRRDRCLDIIFNEVDKLFRRGEFQICDRLLQMLDVEHLSINLLIGFLTITAAAQELLPARELFYSRIEKRLAADPRKDKLLVGLKGASRNAPHFF